MEQMPKTANFPNEIKFKLAKMPAQGVCVCVCVLLGAWPIMSLLKMSSSNGQPSNNNNNPNIMNEIMLKTYFSLALGEKQKMSTNFVLLTSFCFFFGRGSGKMEVLRKSPGGGCFPISKQ